MILSFVKANAQSSEKIEKVRDAVQQSNIQMSSNQLNDLKKLTGYNWGPVQANRYFSYEPDGHRDKPEGIPNLDLDKYKHVVELKKQNHTKDGNFNYEINIDSKSHIPYVIKYIKEKNKIPGAKVKVYYKNRYSPSNDFNL